MKDLENDNKVIPPTDAKVDTSNLLKCPMCEKNVKKLYRHSRITHGVDKDLNPTFQQLKYQCHHCGKPIRDNSNLTRHQYVRIKRIH